MSDITLFRIAKGKATEIEGESSDLERPLQTLIEENLDPLLGIRFLATEHSTGKTHGGRIDSLGIDENNCPVILEYKRSVGENVINQGLFYLDWLMDHKAEFQLLVMNHLGSEAASKIDWSAPRLICIAADFTRYDGHAVQQINRNIDLIRYRKFGDDLLLLELVSAVTGTKPAGTSKGSKPKEGVVSTPKAGGGAGDKSVAEWLEVLPAPMKELLASLENHLSSLGDDVQRKELKLYVAFKRLRNFATIVPQKGRLLLYLHLNPDQINPLPDNARDVRKSGHWGTGDLELSITSPADLDAAKPLMLKAYEGKAVH